MSSIYSSNDVNDSYNQFPDIVQYHHNRHFSSSKNVQKENFTINPGLLLALKS